MWVIFTTDTRKKTHNFHLNLVLLSILKVCFFERYAQKFAKSLENVFKKQNRKK